MSDKPSLEQLEQAVSRAPDNAPLRYLLGATLASDHEYERAADEMMHALQLQPDLHTARLQLGLLYLTMGQPPSRSRAIWEPLDALAPTSPLRLFKRGLEALVRDDFADCVDLLEQGIRANHDNEPLNHDMGLVLRAARESLVREESRAPGPSGTVAPEPAVRTDFSLYDQ
jgi:tetratricopeptide (TPR) repeat protein